MVRTISLQLGFSESPPQPLRILQVFTNPGIWHFVYLQSLMDHLERKVPSSIFPLCMWVRTQVFVYMEVRGWCYFPQPWSASHFETIFFSKPRTHYFSGWLASKLQRSACLYLPSPEIRGMDHHAQLFTWVLRIYFSSLTELLPKASSFISPGLSTGWRIWDGNLGLQEVSGLEYLLTA